MSGTVSRYSLARQNARKRSIGWLALALALFAVSFLISPIASAQAASVSGWAESESVQAQSDPTPTPEPTATPTPAPLAFNVTGISDQQYMKGVSFGTLNLPAATGGSGSLTYSLSGTLPAGLTFSASARTISGTPTESRGTVSLAYAATDGTDTAFIRFSLLEAMEQKTPTPVPVPPAPGGVSAIRGTGTLTVSWNAAAGATGYNVNWTDDHKSSWKRGASNESGTSVTLSDIDDSKDYYVAVQAVNGSGASGWTDSGLIKAAPQPTPTPKPVPTATPTPVPAPPAPSGVSASRGVGTLNVSWNAAAGATGYNVNWTDDGKASWNRGASNVSGTSVTLNNIDATKDYYVSVQAVNAGGASGWTDSSLITAGQPSLQATPTPADLSFSVNDIADRNYTSGVAFGTLNLPEATGGSGSLTYSLSGTLPAGLSFDSSARTISGTPTEGKGTVALTYQVTDGTDTASIKFNLLEAQEEARAQNNQAPETIASTHDTHHQINPSSDPPGGDNQCYHNHGVSYPSGESSYFSDPDGDTLTITSTSSHPALAAITQVTPVRIRANHPADTWVTITTTATDPGGLSANFTWKYKMTCTTALSVNENSAAGTDVGSVGRKGNSNAAASQYTIEGDAANAFTINSSSGLIEVKSGASLDYETKSSYSGTVKYKASKTVDGTSYTNDSARSVTININNVGGPSANTPTVTRDATTPTTKLDVSWTASTSTHANGVTDYDVQYRLTGASSWTSKSHTGTTTSTELTGLTAGKSYEVQVRATDGEGTGSWSSSGTAITQYTTQTRSIAENSTGNVGAAVDADSNPKGYTLSYSLGGTDASSFDISSSTGQITVATGTTLDYETKKSYSVTVTMAVSGTTSVTGTGNTGLSPNGTGNYLIPVTINITDVNETPQFPKDTDTRSIAENSAAGTNIGAAVTASAGQAALTYSLTGTNASDFDIVSTSGQIRVKSALNYESKTSYSVTVNVTDGKDSSNNDDSSIDDTITVTINVTDVNEPPAKPAAPTVSANSTTPTSKLDVSWTAPTMTGKPAITDYDVQYRKHGESSWTDASFTGTGTSTTLSSLTASKSYEVQVRATNDEGTSDWSDSGTAITDGNAVTRSIAENSAAGTAVGAAVTASSNPNDYTLTHSLGGTDAGKFTIESGSGQIKVKTGTNLDYETKTSYSVTVTVAAAVAQSEGANSQSVSPNNPGNYVIPVTINVTDVNEAPEFTGSTATRSIAENSAVGTNVGAAVTATDVDGDTLEYSLTGTDAGKFDISSSTGQITVKTGHVPNYEAKTSYSVTVNVSDKKNASGTADTAIDDTIAVTINVTDVDEPPDAPAAPTVSANSTTPTSKLDVSWTAPTMTGKPAISDYDVQYRKHGDSSWTDASFTGTGTSTTLTGLTAGKSYEVQVRATNDEGTSAWSDSGTAITDGSGVTRSIAENSAAGTAVGAAVTASSNPNDYTLTHSLSGTDAGKFTIESGSGQIKVKTGTNLDYETKKSYSVTVTVAATVAQSEGANSQSVAPNNPGSYVIPVTINVTDVNEKPELSDGTSATRSIAENSAVGTNVGAAVAATDQDGDTLTYSLTGTDAGKFDISSSTGQITVKTGHVPNYEAKTSYSVTVNVTDKKKPDGTADTAIDDTIAVTINVTDVDEPPDAPAAPTVSANSTTPTSKLDVSWTAPTMTGKPAISDYDVQYRKHGDSSWTDASFTGTGTSTTLTGLTAGKSYEVQVRATNDEGTSAWSDSGTAITEGSGVTRSIAENSAAGTAVGAAVTASSNPNSYTLTHSLSGTDAGSFTIDSGSGQIKVKTGTNLDYETKKSYSVTVTVAASVAQSEGANSQSVAPNNPGNYMIPVTINVTDVNEKPELTDGTSATRSIAENSAVGTNVGAAVAATDQDGDTLTYSLTGTDAAKFDISSTTGQITVKTGHVPNYEAKTSYSVTVNVTDKKKPDGTADTAIDDTIAVTINVTDVNEPPAAPDAPTVTIHATSPETKLDVSWTAPDMTGKPAISDYDVQYRKHGDSSWSDASFTGTGTSTTLTGLTAGKSYEVQVRATNNEGTGPWSASGSAITDGNAVSRSVPENSAAGTNVGAAVTASSNPNNYTLTHTMSGTDAGKFTIDSGTGQIKVKSGTNLDYETKNSYSVTVTVKAAVAQTQGAKKQSVAPNNPGNYVIPVTIKVTDVNEKPELSEGTSATRSIAENSPVGTNVGAAVTATDVDGDTLTYSLTGTDAGKFDIGSGTGQITVKTGHVPNYEAKTSYSVTVNVTDKKKPDGTADTAIDDTIAVTINVTDVNEPPPQLAAPTVTTNAASPTGKLDVSWAAPTTQQMAGKPAVNDYDVRYRKHGDANWTDASFSGTGTSTTLVGVTASKSYEVQVRAGNVEGEGAWSPSGSAITDGDAVTRSIAENSPAGTAVGAAVTASSNPNNYTLTHSLSGTDAGKFSIDSGTGQIKVGTGTSLDYETKTSYSVVVTIAAASSGGGASANSVAPNNPGNYVVPVTIRVTDVNEISEFTDGTTATRSIVENASVGTNVGAVVTATDVDGDTLTYSLLGTDADSFTIVASTGQIKVKAGHVPDYETKNSYSLSVGASDGKDANDNPDNAVDTTIPVKITVTDVDEPPDAPAAPTVTTNATTPTSKLDVSWTAPDTTGKTAIHDYDVRYRADGASGWTDASFSGTGTSTTLTGLDAGTTYAVQVRARNYEGVSGWSPSGKGKTDQSKNKAPRQLLPLTPTPTPSLDPSTPLLQATPVLDPSAPRVPGPTTPIFLGKSACASAYDFGKTMHLDRHDGGADLDIEIGSISADGSIEVKGFIRDSDLGQTYSIVRYEADGRVVRVWVDPDDPLIHEIPWEEVNTKFTVPVCVVVAIPLDDQFPAVGQMVRRFDGQDDRIFRHVGNLVWRHIPDEGTFQSLGYHWCNVTAANAGYFDQINIGEPLPSSGTAPKDDYPSCWVWGEEPRSR